ncbi:hypothetical protein, partial [Klebsiella pneumoniae]|uniref:hypothetical protein n=1 Tax=Klebsiella pneumoniae TaxID=573 RepID=UPI003AF83C4F
EMTESAEKNFPAYSHLPKLKWRFPVILTTIIYSMSDPSVTIVSERHVILITCLCNENNRIENNG